MELVLGFRAECALTRLFPQSTKAVYDRILDLRIATPQIVINYAMFLEEHKYFEESFKVRQAPRCRSKARQGTSSFMVCREGTPSWSAGVHVSPLSSLSSHCHCLCTCVFGNMKPNL